MDRKGGKKSSKKSDLSPENSSYSFEDGILYQDLSFDDMKTESYSDCHSTLTSMSAVSSKRPDSHWPIGLSSKTTDSQLQARRRWALLSSVMRFVCRCWVVIKPKRYVSDLDWINGAHPDMWQVFDDSAEMMIMEAQQMPKLKGQKILRMWALLICAAKFICRLRKMIKQRRRSSFGKAPIQDFSFDTNFGVDIFFPEFEGQPCSSTSLLLEPEQHRVSQSKARRIWKLLLDHTMRSSNDFEKGEVRPLFNHRVAWVSALFPPDHEFEKDTLIQLWIAAGFFVQEPMEKNAALFFEQCLARGQFEFSRLNLVTGEAMYKVKDPQQCSGSTDNHTVRIESISDLANTSSQITHLSMRRKGLTNFTDLNLLNGAKHLSLNFLQGHGLSITRVPRDFFLSMPLLCTLDLSRTHLIELPSSIGSMTCLHYIDLSETPINCLPETIECLARLQTLKLRGCSNFSTLPNGMSKLVNLRHLDLDIVGQLSSMPPEMGALTKLRTLSAFIVDEEEECSIRQLMDMNNLSGSFCISRLENVSTIDEAIVACLYKKSELRKLEFHWSSSQREDAKIYGDVLSSLRPTTSLEELQVSCYGGSEFPGWVSDPEFTKLVSITLLNCGSCLVLPSLGQLPLLKYLDLIDFDELLVIDQKFYRGSSTQGHIAFPALEKLTIENMNGLEKWEQIMNDDFPCLRSLNVKNCPKLCCFFRVLWLNALEYLEITHCPMLASFPYFDLPTSLKEIIIEGCPSIAESLKTNRLRMGHIPSVWVDHQEIWTG